MALASGARLGLYDIVALIGVGGMGEVYKARDPRLDREVAIKVLPAGLTSKTEMVQRFQREGRAVAAVNHPSIVRSRVARSMSGPKRRTNSRALSSAVSRRIVGVVSRPPAMFATSFAKPVGTRSLVPPSRLLASGQARVLVLTVLEGSLRQAGRQLRAAAKLIDTSTGANLWAENYTMVHGQLGNRDAAGRALAELLAVYPDFPAHARQEIEKFFYAQRARAEHVIEGLRKAGLEIPGNAPVVETAATSGGGSGPMPGDQAT